MAKMTPLTTSLSYESWPKADQQAWRKALTTGDILDDDPGPATLWRSTTRMNNQRAYGLWLTFVLACQNVRLPPAARITREAVRAYIDLLRPLMASSSLWAQIQRLLSVAKVIAPDQDWSWLNNVVGRLEQVRVPKRDKLSKLRPAHEIATAAFSEMDRLLGQDDRSKRCLLDYRDSLMMALLISCPIMRRKNLVSIRIGQHLQALPDGFRLRFAGDEMKGGRPAEVFLPEDLVIYMRRYLEEWRPLLCPSASEDALWIGKDGRPLNPDPSPRRYDFLNFHLITISYNGFTRDWKFQGVFRDAVFGLWAAGGGGSVRRGRDHL